LDLASQDSPGLGLVSLKANIPTYINNTFLSSAKAGFLLHFFSTFLVLFFAADIRCVIFFFLLCYNVASLCAEYDFLSRGCKLSVGFFNTLSDFFLLLA
jgi:hypothetical protein